MMAGNLYITGSALNSDECLAGLLKRTSEIDHSIIFRMSLALLAIGWFLRFTL